MISERLKRAILTQLKLPNMELTDETKATDVPGWDSLNHVAVLAAVEKEFGVRFRGLEVLRLKNVGELQALVTKKMPPGAA